MISGKRSKCRSCRFQRCLKARMCPEEVGKLRDLKGPERCKVKTEEENSVIPYFDCDDIRCLQFENISHMGIPFLDRFGLAEGVKYIARIFVNLERSCDNDTFATSVAERNFHSLDVSLRKAVQNPLLVSERTPVGWQPLEALDALESTAKPSYCRLVLHYLEWLAAVEELATLDEKRRLKFTSMHVIPSILFTISFNTFKYKSGRLLLCKGFFFSEKKQQSNDEHRDVTELIVNELERSIVNRIRELDVCEEEYVLLKLVLLFSHKESLGGESNEMMIRLRGKYVQILLQFVKQSQKDCSTERTINRMSSFFELLSSLNKISEMVELCLVHIVALDIAGMRGELTFDLHLRQHW
uniref:NR LBD domain-containing protein n=1 Tax=Haemonchus contortus TaxID=6289 RepID=A0A7I4YI68_HAECO